MRRWYLPLLRYARPEARSLGWVFLFVLTQAVLEALKPWPLKLILDHVLAAEKFPASLVWITRLPGAESRIGLLGILTAASVLFFALIAVSKLFQSYLQAGASARMAAQLGADVFEYVQRLSLHFHARSRIGDLTQRIVNDTGCVREMTLNVLLPLATSTFTLTAMAVVMMKMDMLLTIVALVAAPVLLIAIKLLAGPMAERSYEQAELQGEMMGVAEQTLSAIPIVQAFGQESHEDRRFKELTGRTGKAYLRNTASQLRFNFTTKIITACATAAIFLFGGFHVLAGRLSLGMLLVFISYLASLYQPLETIAYLSMSFATAAGGARRVLEILAVQDAIQERPNAAPLPVSKLNSSPRIEFEEVTFGYETGRPVLHNISLTIEPGEVVAIVGKTGSGKSSLVALLPRLFDPWSGAIRMNGIELRDLQLASLRSQIAIVLQEPYLFPTSVAENISYGQPQAGRNDIIAAAEAAQADEFIRRLPQGYDTIISEGGASLSGGERQRIAIARAFLKNAPILILDEPTAALDAQTEAELAAPLFRLTRGRTTIIVAHRFSLIHQADNVFVLEAGRIIESGSPVNLLARKGIYRELHDLQRGLASVGTEAQKP